MKTHLHLVFIFLANALLAQTTCPVQVENVLRVYPLDGCTKVYLDSTEALTIEELRQERFQEKFQPLNDSVTSEKNNGAYWLLTKFIAEDSLTDWNLLLKNPEYKEQVHRSIFTAGHCFVDGYFVFSNGEILQQRDGLFLPKSERKNYHHPLINALPFSVGKGDTATVFIRIFNPEHDQSVFSLELRPQTLGIPLEKTDMSILMGISMGVTGILALLCIFFFYVDKDPSNLFFSLLCICLMLHYALLHPELLFVSWFIPEKPWLVDYAWILLTNGGLLAFVLFGRFFVNLREHSILLDRVMLGLAGVLGLLLIFLLLKQAFFWKINSFFVSVSLVISVIIIAFRIGFLKSHLAKIFAFGAIWLLFFNILGLVYNAGYFDLFLPWPVGQMGLMVIYTYGLAYKLQLNERAKSEAQRILELDAVKSRFFANISHEFRTPLTLILGPLKKAEEQLPASEQHVFSDNGKEEISLPARHLGMMRRNAERLQQLIDQLLDLSKLENGSMKLQVAEGEVVPFVRAMVFSFESLAERRQIHFQTSFPDGGKKAYFDQDKLEKILVNLLSNAFKYTPEKGKVSVVSTLENGRLKVSVADSGPGISKENLDKIFERFYQVEGTEDKGTGIGLSLVKELVELHRGQISVESAPNKGTVFKVSLPVGKESFLPEEILESAAFSSAVRQSGSWQSAVGSQSMFVPTDGLKTDELRTAELSNYQTANSKPTLLIVEDNPDLRRFIAETMHTEYQIITAENGKIGTETAIEHTPDLIVSDVMMPEMDGFELCETLKKDERTSHIPIILLTAKAGQRHKVEGLETGADDYLTKPFDEQELMVRAKNLVEQRRKLQAHFAKMTSQGKNGMSPMTPNEVVVTSTDQRFLEKVSAAIEQNLDNEFFSVEDLASEVAFSRSQLHRKLKSLTGKSPNELIREFRLCRAKELLEKGAGNVSEVAMEVGYSSLSYFTRSFKQAFGVSPSEV